MKRLFTLLIILIAFGFSAPKILVKHPWIMEPPPGPNTTMMGMVIENQGDEPDELLKVETDIAERVELHKTVMENEVAKMVHQHSVIIPPRSKVEFKHHGYHVMLIGLKKPIKNGDKVKVKLIFKKSGEIELEVPVVKMHHMHH
ncbi:copper chaperone PCu(A)C [Aquifex pyrophilus]